mmetsp:Transcript_22623/g.62974  ORF Transcript_22623/g.62974 Transcript_22623/m.62974 type:complete len:275 (+) Transcript_22623:175-999(+)
MNKFSVPTLALAATVVAAAAAASKSTPPQYVPTRISFEELAHGIATDTDEDYDDNDNGNGNDNQLNMDVDRPAGYDCRTPLHFAAASANKTNNPCVDPSKASEIVFALLVEAGADPTVLDASGRPPYFLAGHDKTREAFRRARAVLGEDYCDWNDRARVGPPLHEGDLEAKKKREAEKKRRKRARQKELKEKDRAAAREAEEQHKAQEEARRVRDGLSAAPSKNACDFCHTVCRGRNASKNMFRRLEYKYCSTECVNKHKRELMAAAAMARFGS